MKLAKKFMTLALATALGVGCVTVGVSAAGSAQAQLQYLLNSLQSMKLFRRSKKQKVCRSAGRTAGSS